MRTWNAHFSIIEIVEYLFRFFSFSNFSRQNRIFGYFAQLIQIISSMINSVRSSTVALFKIIKKFIRINIFPKMVVCANNNVFDG